MTRIFQVEEMTGERTFDNTTPKELFDKIPQWLFDGKECPRILYAGMTPLRESLVDYTISLEADVKLGNAKIKFPARYHFRFCDKLLMQFVYAGLSFDRLIIDPKYKSTNRTADADNVEVHIYVQDDPKDNRLQIKFHR